MGRFPLLSAAFTGGLLALARLAAGFLPVVVQFTWLPVIADAVLFGVIGFVTTRRAVPGAPSVRLVALVAPAALLVAVVGLFAGARVTAWSTRGAWLGSLVVIPAAALAGARLARRLRGRGGQATAAVSRGAM